VAKNIINIPAKNIEASQVESSLGSAIKTKLVKSLEDQISQDAYVTLAEKQKEVNPQQTVVKSFGSYNGGIAKLSKRCYSFRYRKRKQPISRIKLSC